MFISSIMYSQNYFKIKKMALIKHVFEIKKQLHMLDAF